MLRTRHGSRGPSHGSGVTPWNGEMNEVQSIPDFRGDCRRSIPGRSIRLTGLPPGNSPHDRRVVDSRCVNCQALEQRADNGRACSVDFSPGTRRSARGDNGTRSPAHQAQVERRLSGSTTIDAITTATIVGFWGCLPGLQVTVPIWPRSSKHRSSSRLSCC